MKIPVCMPTYNRPEYLKQSLLALSVCSDIDDFMLVTSEEPNEDTNALLSSLLPELGIDFKRNQNDSKLGCVRNCQRSFEMGLSVTDADWGVYLEDDMVLARDALRWLKWAEQEYSAEESVLSWSTFQAQQKGTEWCAEDLPCCTIRNSYRTGGAALSKEGFARVQHCFDLAEGSDSPIDDWDVQIEEYMKQEGLFQVVPTVSRNQNIGRHGKKTTDQGKKDEDEAKWAKFHRVYNFVGDVDYPDVEYAPLDDGVLCAMRNGGFTSFPPGFELKRLTGPRRAK